MRKIFHALAAAIMATVLGVTCLGATTAQAADYDKTVTFKGVNAGDEVYAYHVVTYDQNYNKFVFDSSFQSFVEAEKSASSASSKTVDQYFADLSSAERSQLLDKYASACSDSANTSYNWPATPVRGTAGADLNVKLTLDPGYYVIIATTTADNNTIYTPTSVFVQVQGSSVTVYGGANNAVLDSYSPTVELKHQTGPTISKAVWGTAWSSAKTTELGKLEYFYINVTVPAYNQAARAAGVIDVPLKVTDRMAGMALDTSLSGEPVRAMDSANGSGSEIVGAITSWNWDAATGELTVDLDFDVVQGKTVYLCYGARTTAAAAAGNKASNTAMLDYANPITGEQKTTDAQTVNLWLFSLNLLKVDGSDVPLDGAKFTLSASNAQDATAISLVKEGDYYRPATVVDAADVKVTEIPGNSVVKGLDATTYTLKEVATPAGYYAPNGNFTVTLNTDSNGGQLNGSLASGSLTGPDSDLCRGAVVNAANNNQLDVTIANSTMPVLPSTGGMGTALFTIGGVALMAVAAVAFVVIRRKGEQK